MIWFLLTPVAFGVGFFLWDWGRIRYLLGRTDAFYEITGYLLDRGAAHVGIVRAFEEFEPNPSTEASDERNEIFNEIMARWSVSNKAFVDPKQFPIPKR